MRRVKASRATGPRGAIQVLEKHYGAPPRPPTADPFELVLWENVAYLATPARRREAFAKLEDKVGLSPKAIFGAKASALQRVTSGGILAAAFARKLRECARIALEDFAGDLDAVVRGPVDEARRALRKFPGIGEPGAEKILLLCGRHPFLAPESNGLRVLVRLGFVKEGSSYARTYAASRDVAKQLPARTPSMQAAHLILQHHGRTLCRNRAPLCDACPLARECAHARGGP